MEPQTILAAVVGVVVGYGLAQVLGARQASVSDSAAAGSAKPSNASTAPEPAASTPAPPSRNDAISLLATLQREARFLDIVKEPLGDYTDEQVGAAARDVLADCATVLDRIFKIAPIVDQEEGSDVELPQGSDAARFRVTGSSSSDASSGSLVHHGWLATHCELPTWTGDPAAALVLAPAELEVK